MLRFLLPLLLAPLLSGTAARADALKGPPSLQGFALGATLDEVRGKGHPDREPGDDIRFVCTGDALARQAGLDLAPEPGMARIGVKLCLFVGRDGSGRWDTARLRFGRHKLLVAFYFTPRSGDPATSERLYHMGAPFAPAVFDDLAEAMTSRYGAPDVGETVPIRTKEGTHRDAKRLIWLGLPYGIVLQEESSGLASGALTFLDNETFQALKRQAKDGTGAPAVAPGTAARSMNFLPDSVGLHGFILGAPLADLRRQKYPGTSPGDVRLICSGDALSEEAALNFPPGEVAGQIGIKMCRFYTVAWLSVREAPLKVAGHDARVVFFVTPPSADRAFSERLYGIRAEAKGAPFADFAAAYTAEFGKPANPEGVSPRDLMWLNLRTRLMVKDDPRDGVSVLYYDTELERAVDALKTRRSKSGADKL